MGMIGFPPAQWFALRACAAVTGTSPWYGGIPMEGGAAW
eukprot:gene7601-63844_t